MTLSDMYSLSVTEARNIGGQPCNEDLLLLFPLWPTLFQERSITRSARPAASVALQGTMVAVIIYITAPVLRSVSKHPAQLN
jgi:Flp pilus assembly protein CpaB